jgi:hypothetical protein
MGEWFLSRWDRLIVARHEVPGWPEGLCPKGAGGLSPGGSTLGTDAQSDAPSRGDRPDLLTTRQLSPIVARLNSALNLSAATGARFYQVRLSPLQGELVYLEGSQG